MSETPVALVTGAARRVGRAIALELADAGYDLAVTYRESEADAASLACELQAFGREVVLIKVDFMQADAVEVITHSVRDQFGRLNVLINNASLYECCPVGDVKETDFFAHMRVNSFLPLQLIQAFQPELAANYHEGDKHSTGRVINFVDTHIMGKPLPHYASYNASKAALREITQTCALELAPCITVNAIAPGVVAWSPSYSGEKRREILQRIPLEHAGTPEDVAKLVRFLVKDGHYVTGEVLRLDGGFALT